MIFRGLVSTPETGMGRPCELTEGAIRSARLLAGLVAAGLAALALLAAPVLAVEIPFGLQTVISGAIEDNPRFVTSADLDGDGDLDVLAAFSFSNQIVWYENDGNLPPGFTPHDVSFLALGAMSVHPADLDGDGDLDILAASFDDDTIGWYRNLDGAGTFGNRITISSAADGAQSVFAADLDHDGDLDVLSASYDDDTIAWYRNDGASPPSFTTRLITEDPDGGGAMQGFADGARSVRAADVDGDGDLDLVSASALNHLVAWYESDGASPPLFTAHVITYGAGGTGSVDVADVNGDGRLDVVATAILDDRVSWYVNGLGGARPWTHRLVTTFADGALSVQAADVDRDGDVDVIAASFFDDTVAWYENETGDANNWTERQITTSATGATSAHAADLDGDGDLDAIAAASTDDVVGWHENLTIHRSAFFPEQSVITTGVGLPRSVFAADLDRDGDQDVLSASTINGSINWYQSDGAATPVFAAHLIDSLAPASAYSVRAEDLDNDGDIDVVAGSRNKITWYENSGASTPAFTPYTIANQSGLAASVFAADLDGDGDHDVLASSHFNDEINWYENDGASPPSFSPHSISTAADQARSVFAADLDSDGDLDVLSGSSGNVDLVWYRNDGGSPPSFTPDPIANSLNDPESIFAADLDRDGDLDVVSISNSQTKVAWYENDGAALPGFAEHIVFDFGGGGLDFVSVFPADLDGDGDLDLLSTSRRGLAWDENDGGSPPAFADTTFLIEDGSSCLAVDLDGDGDLDTLSAAVYDDNIAWYENRGGQFALPTTDLSQGFLFDAQVDDVLRIELHHRGRSGDSDLQLTSLELLLESAPDVPLNDSQAMNLIQEIRVHLDDGSGAFDPAADTEVTAVTVFNLVDGVLSTPFAAGDPTVTLASGTPKTFFVTVEMTTDASAQTPASFLLTHLTESTSTAVDAAHNIPLELEASPEMTVGPIDTLLSDTSCTAALDLVLIGVVSVDFPLVCEAGRAIRVGGGFQIVGPLGAVTFRAGEGVELADGLTVEAAGALAIEVDPLLLPP